MQALPPRSWGTACSERSRGHARACGAGGGLAPGQYPTSLALLLQNTCHDMRSIAAHPILPSSHSLAPLPLQELYFRHLYAKTVPSLRARCESWDNYMDLFGVILHNNVNMQVCSRFIAV